jgi:hypothetical protein
MGTEGRGGGGGGGGGGGEGGGEIQTKGIGNFFNNILGKTFLNVEKGREIQVEEAFRMPNRQNQKRNTPRHIII